MSQLLSERRSAPAPERWGPLGELDQVSERMRRMLAETFGGWPSLIDGEVWAPPVDIEEVDDAYVVEADLPGVKKSDVKVELVGNELTITGEIKQRERKGALRRHTRRVGRFEYRVALPGSVDAEKIEASLAEGVLTVRVPKFERAQRRKIQIKS